MRNKNPDIIIHHLVKKAENRKRLHGNKYDAAEEMRIEQEKIKDLQDKHDKQAFKESCGRFVLIQRGCFKCRILVKEDEDEAEAIERFIEKMEKQGRNLV